MFICDTDRLVDWLVGRAKTENPWWVGGAIRVTNLCSIDNGSRPRAGKRMRQLFAGPAADGVIGRWAHGTMYT